jgi:tetratricopeptide (TPR) repeat protein
MNALQTIEGKYRRAEKAQERGQLRQAARQFRQLSMDAPSEPLFHWKLGYVLMEMQDHQGAIREFRHALKLDPKNVAAFGGLGQAYMELGKWSLAEKAFRKRLALKRSPEQFVFLAHVLMMRERPREAAVMCRRAVALDSSFAEAFFNLGLAYRQWNKPKKAVEAFTKAIALDSQYADGYRELGWTCYARGDLESARKLLEKSLSLNPKDAWASLYLGIYFEQVGDCQRAQKHFQTALKLESDNPIFHKQYTEFLRQSVPSNGNGRTRK